MKVFLFHSCSEGTIPKLVVDTHYDNALSQLDQKDWIAVIEKRATFEEIPTHIATRITLGNTYISRKQK